MSGDGQVVFPETPPPEASAASQKEAAEIASRKLQRRDRSSTHRHWGGIVAWWAFVAIGVAFALSWAWDLVGPEQWRYLTDAQRNDIHNVLIAILGSAGVTKAFDRWFDD